MAKKRTSPKKRTPPKKSPTENSRLKKDFENGVLKVNDLGAFIEALVEYRGYYIRRRRAHWAGPWRKDQLAAAADVFPYVQQGFQTGIEMKQS